MNRREFEAIGRSLLPELPGFTVNKSWLLMVPIGHTLRAIVFDSSGFDKDLFFVHVVLQPLCVPAKHVGLNLGWRIGGGSHRWDSRSPTIRRDLAEGLKRDAVPFLDRARSVSGVVKAIESLDRMGDPYVRQAMAYALLKDGQTARASYELAQLTRMLDIRVPWQREMVERANLLREMIVIGVAKAQDQLRQWELQSIGNLGLARHVA